MSAMIVRKKLSEIANSMAGGLPLKKKGHHYELETIGKGVLVRLVLAPKAARKNRAKLRYYRLLGSLQRDGMSVKKNPEGAGYIVAVRAPKVKTKVTKSSTKKAA